MMTIVILTMMMMKTTMMMTDHEVGDDFDDDFNYDEDHDDLCLFDIDGFLFCLLSKRTFFNLIL